MQRLVNKIILMRRKFIANVNGQRNRLHISKQRIEIIIVTSG